MSGVSMWVNPPISSYKARAALGKGRGSGPQAVAQAVLTRIIHPGSNKEASGSV